MLREGVSSLLTPLPCVDCFDESSSSNWRNNIGDGPGEWPFALGAISGIPTETLAYHVDNF